MWWLRVVELVVLFAAIVFVLFIAENKEKKGSE